MSAAARVTFTLTRYSPLMSIAGAAHMATQLRDLERTPGLSFFRLMGTGAGIGFSARPDLRRWAMLGAWSSEEAWWRFSRDSRVMRQYRERGRETYTVLLEPTGGHGRWGGRVPWPMEMAEVDPAERIAVLTRASIRPRRAARFWSRVAPVQDTLRDRPELLLSVGAGEVPYLRQATLSVWQSGRAMQRWAYGTPDHAEVIRRTREEGWYSEELFSRFRVVGTEGTLDGGDPLAA